ncbi:MAG: hypothetical protein H7Y04_14105, partial [Verrucomicrobia bacterium]|nr:hypothetical protein [Cytophagales bacterium]
NICWTGNTLTDWLSGGTQYFLDGSVKEADYGFLSFHMFDSCISSDDGAYVFVYQKLGTKGLLMKDGNIMREINRSYYMADSYEYPAAFVRAKNGKTYLVHCPVSYCQLDFEDVETGEILTNNEIRKPVDCFHARLEISPGNEYLLSKGWLWQPVDVVQVYDIEQCLLNPTLLDVPVNSYPLLASEVAAASFIDNERLLFYTGGYIFDKKKTLKVPQGRLIVWNIKENKIEAVQKPDFMVGNLFAIDENFAWDLYDFPKLINLKTGKIENQIEEIDSGRQGSAIINHLDKFPQIAFNKHTKQIAIANPDIIEILSV